MLDDPAAIAAEALGTAAYRPIAPSLAARIASRLCSGARGSRRDLIRSVRGELHQAVGAYMPQGNPWPAMLAQLDSAIASGEVDACVESLLTRHASTRERLPHMRDLFAAAFGGLGDVRSVLDLGCGLQPLGISLMGIPAVSRYIAVDAHAGLLQFLRKASGLLGLPVETQAADLAGDVQFDRVDVVLALKLLPVLDHAGRGAAEGLLRRLDARFLVVSYPLRTLGGRSVGMRATYAERFASMDLGCWTRVKEFATPNEAVYVLARS